MTLRLGVQTNDVWCVLVPVIVVGCGPMCPPFFVIVIVKVFVIAVGAGSARPNMVQTTDCTDLHRLLFFSAEYTERTEYHGFYF